MPEYSHSATHPPRLGKRKAVEGFLDDFKIYQNSVTLSIEKSH
jgi:hypothetical protein